MQTAERHEESVAAQLLAGGQDGWLMAGQDDAWLAGS